MKIPFILVGCGKFSLQRLQILIESKKFEPVACVDLDTETAKINLQKNNKLSFLTNKVFKTITEAQKKIKLKCALFMQLQDHILNYVLKV